MQQRQDWLHAHVGKATQISPVFSDRKVGPKVASAPTVDYSHFLIGNPNNPTANDPSGKTILKSLKDEIRSEVGKFYFSNGRPSDFSLPGDVKVDGTKKGYPPPTTGYWKNILGHHRLEIDVLVHVEAKGNERIFWIFALVRAYPIVGSNASPTFRQSTPFRIQLEHHLLGVPDELRA